MIVFDLLLIVSMFHKWRSEFKTLGILSVTRHISYYSLMISRLMFILANSIVQMTV
jgi:hypothetical protein